MYGGSRGLARQLLWHLCNISVTDLCDTIAKLKLSPTICETVGLWLFLSKKGCIYVDTYVSYRWILSIL